MGGCSSKTRRREEGAVVATRTLTKADTTAAKDGLLKAVGGYKVGKQLGQGAYGLVYEATDGESRSVAIKVRRHP